MDMIRECCNDSVPEGVTRLFFGDIHRDTERPAVYVDHSPALTLEGLVSSAALTTAVLKAVNHHNLGLYRNTHRMDREGGNEKVKAVFIVLQNAMPHAELETNAILATDTIAEKLRLERNAMSGTDTITENDRPDWFLMFTPRNNADGSSGPCTLLNHRPRVVLRTCGREYIVPM